MTKLDRNRLDKIEREEWMLNHPGWWQKKLLNIILAIASVLIGILIFYWCSMARITEVEAAVFHKETDTILYVERLDTTKAQKVEFPPEAIEVDSSSPSDAEAEIEGSGISTTEYSEEEKWESLGRWKLTAYDPFECCNGRGRAWKTASGAPMVIGETVATARLPFGTKLKVDGRIYIVTDRGTPYRTLDILHESHSAANRFGVKYAEVFILR